VVGTFDEISKNLFTSLLAITYTVFQSVCSFGDEKAFWTHSFWGEKAFWTHSFGGEKTFWTHNFGSEKT